jgi:hypothetical protein
MNKKKKIINIQDHFISIEPALSPARICDKNRPFLIELIGLVSMAEMEILKINKKGILTGSKKKELLKAFINSESPLSNKLSSLFCSILLNTAEKTGLIKIEKARIIPSLKDPFEHESDARSLAMIDQAFASEVNTRLLFDNPKENQNPFLIENLFKNRAANSLSHFIFKTILPEIPVNTWIELKVLDKRFTKKLNINKNMEKEFSEFMNRVVPLFFYFKGYAQLGLDNNDSIVSLRIIDQAHKDNTEFICSSLNENIFIRVSSKSSYSFLRLCTRLSLILTQTPNPFEILLRVDKKRCLKSFARGLKASEILSDIRNKIKKDIPQILSRQVLSWWKEYGEIQIISGELLYSKDKNILKKALVHKSVKTMILQNITPNLCLLNPGSTENMMAKLAEKELMPQIIQTKRDRIFIDSDLAPALLWALTALKRADGNHENRYSSQIKQIKNQLMDLVNPAVLKETDLEAMETLFYIKKNLKILENEKSGTFLNKNINLEKSLMKSINPLLKKAITHEIPMKVIYYGPSETEKIIRHIHGPYSISKHGKAIYLKAFTHIFKENFTIKVNKIISIILE